MSRQRKEPETANVITQTDNEPCAQLGGQVRDRDAVQGGEPVAGRDQDPERVLAEQQRGDAGRGERGYSGS